MHLVYLLIVVGSALLTGCEVPADADTALVRRVPGTTTTTTAGTTTTTLQGPMVNWESQLVTLWHMDEASGTRVNDADTTCGATCNLSVNGTVSQATGGDKIEGTAAAQTAVSPTGWLSVADNAALSFTGSYTVFGWFNGVTGDSGDLIDKRNGGNPGYELSRLDATDELQCVLGQAASSSLITASGFTDGVFHFAYCRYDGATLTGDVDLSGSPGSTSAGAPADNAITLEISDASNYIAATFDGIGMDDSAIALASLCRICACDASGAACGDTACTGTSYTACSADSECDSGSLAGSCDTTAGLCQGRKTINCAACTMPATCNQGTM